MSSPFIGEIRLTAFNWTMMDWAACDGMTIPIAQNSTLFSLIGTTYGGDGIQNFALPDLRSRIPIGQGNAGTPGGFYTVGGRAGAEQVALQATHLPAHTHAVAATGTAGTIASPTNQSSWAGCDLNAFSANPAPTLVPMASGLLTSAGNSAPHENRMPTLALCYQICLYGIYPSRS